MDALQYAISITDRGSATTLSRVTGGARQAHSQLVQLTRQNRALEVASGGLNKSLGGLGRRMGTIRRTQLIDPSNVRQLSEASREVNDLDRGLKKLERTGSGGGLKSLFGNLGGLGRFLTNPLTIAGAAAGYGGKTAMSFDEGMAKINITAELDPAARKQLERDIKEISARNKFDVNLAPDAFEQIISQIPNVEITKDVFEQTIRGAKGGFADLRVVAGALAQTASIIGADKVKAGEILDTFFSAKRVGAGEFTDFATYMPGLIASGDALGVKYKEVAGLYAYMTGKGQAPEKAAVLLDNMFSMLGRGDIVDQLNASGIKTHDKAGNILPMADVFGNMGTLMNTMSDKAKSEFLENIGINRLEAKKAFMVMVADNEKLRSSITEVADSAGATDRALEFSKNAMQTWGEVMANFRGKMLDLGTSLLPAITTGMTGLSGAIDTVAWGVSGLSSFFGGWYDALADGNPVVWGLTTALGIAGVLLAAHTIKLKAITLWSKLAAAAKGLFGGAIKAANASMLATPWGIALVGVAALVGGIVALTTKTSQATKQFASFNAELRKSKNEAKGEFDAAMQAKEGSEERAESIAKINKQYGDYLPSLLTEKSTNDELAIALSQVNAQLEQQLRTKYKNQALQSIEEGLLNTETKVFEEALKTRKRGNAPELTERIREGLDQMRAGLITWHDFANEIESRFGSDIRWDLFFLDIGYRSYDGRKNLVDIQYGGSSAAGATGSEDGTVNPGNDTTLTTLTGGVKKKRGSGGTKSGSDWVNLDKVDGVDEKGTGTYSAIASKLGKVRMAGLAAASVAGIGFTSPGAMPESLNHATQMPSLLADNRDYDSDRKTLNMTKFCDKIEIHVENTDNKGRDQIKDEIMSVLMEVADA